MTARRRFFAATVVSALAASLLTACGGGGKPSDLLVVTPNPKVHATAVAAALKMNCDVVAETAAKPGTDLRFIGPCVFTESAQVQCVKRVDDFYAYINRDLPNNDRLAAFINVEKFKGPGTYTKNSVVSLQVVHDGQLYIWKQDAATLTVDPGVHSVTVDAATLPASAGTPAAGKELVDGVATCQDG